MLHKPCFVFALLFTLFLCNTAFAQDLGVEIDQNDLEYFDYEPNFETSNDNYVYDISNQLTIAMFRATITPEKEERVVKRRASKAVEYYAKAWISRETGINEDWIDVPHVKFRRGEAIFIYVSGQRTWENRLYAVNTTLPNYPSQMNYSGTFNFSNQTGGGWNLIIVWNLSGTTLGKIAESINYTGSPTYNETSDTNITFFSYFNNSQSNVNYRFVPFISTWTINENVTVDYGEPVWAFWPYNIPGRWNRSSAYGDI